MTRVPRFLQLPSVALALAVGLTSAACGAGTPTATASPPIDTTPRGTPVTAVLDSLRAGGVSPATGAIVLWGDTITETMPPQFGPGSMAFVPSPSFVAFTNVGPVADAPTIQAMFGPITLASGNLLVITPGGSCTGAGWPCMTIVGRGSTQLRYAVGGKLLNEVVLVR